MNTYLLLATTPWDDIVTALSSTFSSANIISVITTGLTAALPLVLLWWGGRRIFRTIMVAFKSGRARLG